MTRSLCRFFQRTPAAGDGRRGVRAAWRSPAVRRAACAVVAAAACAGCKSDMSQQLLERELRMQEDQIYQLQDELEAKCARLERVAGENTSLRRQLGFVEGDAAGPTIRTVPATRSGQPTLVPPPLTMPGAPPAGSGPPRLPPPISAPAAPGGVAPPKLEGVPPLPSEPRLPGAAAPSRPEMVVPAAAVVPATTEVDPAALPMPPAAAVGQPDAVRRLSHEESLSEAGRITHIVVNQSRTACFDGTGDGVSDGLALVVEPRDGDERLVPAAGDVTVTVLDERGGQAARWDIPAQEAVAHFRRTSRNRGLHLVLRWPGPAPQGAAARIQVTLTSFEGALFETSCTVPLQPAAADADR
jgi:hypothetical protein